tara:strand:- start:222 stop:512 length:291 start_codon:yes stop_codon:yes gene_type:complete
LKLLLGVVWLYHFRQQNFMISFIGYLNEDSLFLITFELDDDVQQQIFACVCIENSYRPAIVNAFPCHLLGGRVPIWNGLGLLTCFWLAQNSGEIIV